MAESEKKGIEQQKKDFFKRAEQLTSTKPKIERSLGQDPRMIAAGKVEVFKRPEVNFLSNIKGLGKEERDKVYEEIFGEKASGMSDEAKEITLAKIAKADEMLLKASMLITSQNDSFPGIDSKLLKQFFEGRPDEQSIAAYDEFKAETLMHYGVRDLPDYSRYVGYMMKRMFPGKENDQK
jgi:hypothetical protein